MFIWMFYEVDKGKICYPLQTLFIHLVRTPLFGFTTHFFDDEKVYTHQNLLLSCMKPLWLTIMNLPQYVSYLDQNNNTNSDMKEKRKIINVFSPTRICSSSDVCLAYLWSVFICYVNGYPSFLLSDSCETRS